MKAKLTNNDVQAQGRALHFSKYSPQTTEPEFGDSDLGT